jgi:pyruvate dehydrogenase E1 component beta subunit
LVFQNLSAVKLTLIVGWWRNSWEVDLPAQLVIRVNAADTPLPFTPTLIDAALPSVERTVKAVKEVMYLVK